MKHSVAALDKRVENGAVGDAGLDEAAFAAEVRDVAGMAAGKVIEQGNAMPAGDQGFGKVRADKSGPAGDEVVCHS